jgi:integral membrane protein
MVTKRQWRRSSNSEYAASVAPSLVSVFRIVAILEGISFLVLLLIAMPLKYWAGEPLAVRVVGMAHGVLFIGYVLLLGLVARVERWRISRALLGLLASLVPFGPFLFEAHLRRERASAAATGRDAN